MRLVILCVFAAAVSAAPFPPTVHLVGALPETLDMAAWLLRGPWRVEGCSAGLDVTFHGDSVVVQAVGDPPALSLLRLWSPLVGEVVIPIEHRTPSPVSFSYAPGDPRPRTVTVAGSFNGWNPQATPMERGPDGLFRATLTLRPGTYHYKFVVDGTWLPDPGNPERADDGLGGFNSVLYIPRGTSTHRFVKATYRDSTLTFAYQPAGERPSTVIVLQDCHEAPFTFAGDSLRVRPHGGSLLRVLGTDREGRPLPECWTWLDRGVPRGLPGTDPGTYGSFIYSLFPDRFLNGDPSNDRPLVHPSLHDMVNYQGGDLAGVIATIERGYFDSLGVTTLWMGPLYPGPERIAVSPLDYTDEMRGLTVAELDSLLWSMVDPVFGSRSLPIPEEEFPQALAYSGYHGYWPARDYDVEPRFGSLELMKRLVWVAHERGLRVILDLVPHHVHEDHPWAKAHPDWFQPLTLPDGTLNLRHWDAHRLTTWFDPFLPTLDLRRGSPAVDSVVASAVWWQQTFDLDGFRHDATKHIPHDFWRALTAGLSAASSGRPLLQVGETFGDRSLVGSYAVPAEMDGQFDFTLYYAARPLFCGRPGASFVHVAREIEQSLDAFGPIHLMANITGSHDQVRFVTLAQQDIPPGENERRWGWTHRLSVTDPAAYRRLQLFFLFNVSLPGIPVLYYGDEIGMPGAADPDNRRMMRFGEELEPAERAHLAAMRQVGRLRRDLPALTFGDLVVLHVEERALVLGRMFFDDAVVAAFNLSEEPWGTLIEHGAPTRRLQRRWGEGKANQYAGTLRLDLPPMSALVLATR